MSCKVDIINNANALAKLFYESEEYKFYLESKKQLEIDENLLSSCKNFKKVQLEYQLKVTKGEMPSFNEERIISKLYSDLMANEKTRNFLESEKTLLSIYEEVFDVLSNACNINLELNK